MTRQLEIAVTVLCICVDSLKLLWAVCRNDVRRVAALIEAGVHIDAVDEYGMTALMIAAWLKHVE
eukprot:gene33782-41673_t